jgi:uncharacterized protein YueI
MKKYLILAVLFILPIVAYLFFSSGVNHFAKLPVKTENIGSLSDFKSLDGDSLQLKKNISILLFFGDQVKSMQGNAIHIKEKIFDKNHAFSDFQLIIVAKNGMQTEAKALEDELKQTVATKNWRFAFGSEAQQKALFKRLKTDLSLDEHQSTAFAFIIDKERNLRGRDDDEGEGDFYGYNTQSVAVLNNKMIDDVDVILAEYRLALKKYRENNKIQAK